MMAGTTEPRSFKVAVWVWIEPYGGTALEDGPIFNAERWPSLGMAEDAARNLASSWRQLSRFAIQESDEPPNRDAADEGASTASDFRLGGME